jgi:glycerol-3-phosphate dehydrogenase
MVIIGGGATGVGVAVDAASRGYDVLLLEKYDFGKGTSSRSTKLVHGGVRYLEQGNIPLVMSALRERGLLRQNAPHLVHNLPFIVPNYDWWEAPFYGLGLKMYDLLAGKYGFGPSRLLSKEEILAQLPTVRKDGLRGGVGYFDGQFDDSRLLINLVATAAEQGATLLNYAPVLRLIKDAEGYVIGTEAEDSLFGKQISAQAKVVINATGAFVDNIRQLDDPNASKMIAPSQGIHLVFGRSVLPGDTAIMVPHTSDGRVMFAIPWHDHVVVGTTDTPIAEATAEPIAQEQEIDFILETAKMYLTPAPSYTDVLSVFVGIRPLVKLNGAKSTAALSRDHVVHIDQSALLTICGGKWTTYRLMAEDCVDHAIMLGKLTERECRTRSLHVHGFCEDDSDKSHLSVYGSDADKIRQLAQSDPELGTQLHPRLPYLGAEVVWAVRSEMAQTVEDVLARRTRALFLDAAAALELAPRVAAIMARELNQCQSWKDQQVRAFQDLAKQYLLSGV